VPVDGLRFERSYVAIVRAHGQLGAAEQEVLDLLAAAAAREHAAR
jgi:hypothetical protein